MTTPNETKQWHGFYHKDGSIKYYIMRYKQYTATVEPSTKDKDTTWSYKVKNEKGVIIHAGLTYEQSLAEKQCTDFMH